MEDDINPALAEPLQSASMTWRLGFRLLEPRFSGRKRAHCVEATILKEVKNSFRRVFEEQPMPRFIPILHRSQRSDPWEPGDGVGAFVVVMEFTQGDAQGVFDGSQ